jgi:hypothetical protein
MLFLRVLDFVVADAVEALDKHHDGGDAKAGDFRGVVEGAGRGGGVGMAPVSAMASSPRAMRSS